MGGGRPIEETATKLLLGACPASPAAVLGPEGKGWEEGRGHRQQPEGQGGSKYQPPRETCPGAVAGSRYLQNKSVCSTKNTRKSGNG